MKKATHRCWFQKSLIIFAIVAFLCSIEKWLLIFSRTKDLSICLLEASPKDVEEIVYSLPDELEMEWAWITETDKQKDGEQPVNVFEIGGSFSMSVSMLFRNFPVGDIDMSEDHLIFADERFFKDQIPLNSDGLLPHLTQFEEMNYFIYEAQAFDPFLTEDEIHILLSGNSDSSIKKTTLLLRTQKTDYAQFLLENLLVQSDIRYQWINISNHVRWINMLIGSFAFIIIMDVIRMSISRIKLKQTLLFFIRNGIFMWMIWYTFDIYHRALTDSMDDFFLFRWLHCILLSFYRITFLRLPFLLEIRFYSVLILSIEIIIKILLSRRRHPYDKA